MTVIVNSGSTINIGFGAYTLTADSTIDAGGVLEGAGQVFGPGFALVNQGLILSTPQPMTFLIGSFINQGTIESAAGTISLGDTVTGGGTIKVDTNAGWFTQPGSYAQTFINNGIIFAPTASVGAMATLAGPYFGTGTLYFPYTSLSDGGGVELTSSFFGTINFADNPGTVVIDSPSSFIGTVANLVRNEAIVLQGVEGDAFVPTNVTNNITSYALTEGGVTLATMEMTGLPPPVQVLGFVQEQSTQFFSFSAVADLLNDTTTIIPELTTDTLLICFASGTGIATPDGEVAIERLAVGDRVLTHFAGERRVTWIGHRTVDCRRQPDPTAIFPVRIVAGAFGDGLPRRDLYLSPGHALFIDGLLIPVKCLLNDTTIAQVPTDTVTYYHIELDEHDVVFAEGLAAESYLDTGNRPSFVNGGASLTLFPGFEAASWETQGCAPLTITGETVRRARELLTARAAAPVERLTPAA